jgi:hypothetical protein
VVYGESGRWIDGVGGGCVGITGRALIAIELVDFLLMRILWKFNSEMERSTAVASLISAIPVGV